MGELFQIRDATPLDAALIDMYAQAEGMDVIPSIERIRVAVEGNDQVVGFCRLQEDVNGIAYVNPIVVYEPWRGYGVGRALIEDAAAIAGELRLISRGTSEGFYRKLGFVEFDWAEADLAAASEDCHGCPHRETCGPVPMKRTCEAGSKAPSPSYASPWAPPWEQ